jgi:hypothetical protein
VKTLALLLLAGCADVGLDETSIDELAIPCTGDDTCPTNAWCDFMGSVLAECRSLDTSSPPHITYDGLTLSGAVVPTLTVPAKTYSDHGFRFRNDGGTEAYVTVDIVAPSCVHAGSEVRSDGELVHAGDVLDASFDTFPDAGCASPATLMITATANKRVFMFTSQIAIVP